MEDKRLILLWGVAMALTGVGTLTFAQQEADGPARSAEEAAAEAPSEEVLPAEVDPFEEAAKVEAEEAQLAHKLVKQLADESFRVREDATRTLWDLGEVGITAVKEGTLSEDPEVAYRSRILLRRIQIGITPDTPQGVVDLVQDYFRADVTGKRNVMQDLLKEDAYIQVLRLYRFEESDSVRKRCLEFADQAVLPAALSALVEGQVKGAEDILRLSPSGDHNSRRLAALLRVQNKLDGEMALVGPALVYDEEGNVEADSMKFANRQLAMLRANGRVEEARELANKMQRPDVVAAMALFEGNPEPYLRWYMAREEESPIVRAHAETVLRRWKLDHAGADRLIERMVEEAKGGLPTNREAMLSLLLNGNVEEGLPLIFSANKDSAFSFYETVELPLEAVNVLGYVGTEEEKEQWLAKRYAMLGDDWSEKEMERYELLTIASFLHTRGEQETARRIMLRLSELARAEGRTTWLEFLGRLNDLGGSLHELAFLIATEHLDAESGVREDLQIVTHLFGEGDAAARLWDALETIERDKDKRILLLGALYGFVFMSQDELQPAIEALEERADGGDVRMLSDLLEAAEARDDAGDSVRLLEQIASEDGDLRWEKKLADYYGYISEWEKAIASLERILDEEPTNLNYLALYGGTLLRAGRDEDARKPLAEVEMFAMDEPLRLMRLALDVERTGAVDAARNYWRLLLMTNGPGDLYWQSSASYYAKHARLQKKWRVAAAFAEVDAMQYLKGRSTYINPVSFIRKRFIADLYRGLALHSEGNLAEAQKLFRSSFEILNGDGILADDYFPLLREAGVIEEHDRNFKIVYERFNESIKAYPKAHNTYNSAAWMASRANRELEDAHEKIRKAVEMRPMQAAYLDTMAEVWFAKRDREKAVEWSRKAVEDSFHGGSSSAAGVGLREQFDRFQSGYFPVP